MLGKILSSIKARIVYWWGLVKEANITSKTIGEATAKVLTVVKVLAPGAVAWAIGKAAHVRPSGAVLYPAVITAAWIMLLMLEAAYKKHKGQEDKIKELEDGSTVKLEIERIGYQRNTAENLNMCRVTVRNKSTVKVAENVHVRMYGDVPPNAFRDGYSPFNEPDLTPATGSRSINPNSESDWLFSKSFN